MTRTEPGRRTRSHAVRTFQSDCPLSVRVYAFEASTCRNALRVVCWGPWWSDPAAVKATKRGVSGSTTGALCRFIGNVVDRPNKSMLVRTGVSRAQFFSKKAARPFLKFSLVAAFGSLQPLSATESVSADARMRLDAREGPREWKAIFRCIVTGCSFSIVEIRVSNGQFA
jgi:hypothetical protein